MTEPTTSTSTLSPAEVLRAADALGSDRVALITGGTPIGSCSLRTLEAIVRAAR